MAADKSPDGPNGLALVLAWAYAIAMGVPVRVGSEQPVDGRWNKNYKNLFFIPSSSLNGEMFLFRKIIFLTHANVKKKLFFS